jgi:antirestriction protein
MRQTTFFFDTEEEASKVAEYIYCNQEGRTIKYDDFTAFKTAMKLAEVQNVVIENQVCKLPFPAHEREYSDENTPKIYVACLSAYNAGHLHGLWIDATQDAEEIEEDINWMLSWSPVRDTETCEEWAIHDYENFDEISISEHQDLETISIFANAICEHGEAMSVYLGWKRETTTNPDWEEII